MTDLKAQVEAAVMARGGKKQGAEICFRCPNEAAHKHGDTDPSANYNPTKAVWICRACGESGNYFHLAHLLGLVDGHRPDGFVETRRWTVGDAIHRRWDKPGERKQVTWQRNGQPTLDGLTTADLPLYGLDLLTPDATDILVSEGEKATDSLLALGLVAVGTACGALTLPSEATLKPLAQHPGRVFLCRDNDEAGRGHMDRNAARLKRMGKVAYMVSWPGVPEKGDAYDYVKAGHTADDVRVVLDVAPLYDGPAEPVDLPQIIVSDRQLRDISGDALAALYAANNPPRLFRRSGTLARINVDEQNRPFIENISESALRGLMTLSADFVRVGKGESLTAVSPPLDVVRNILGLEEWQFPPLLGITESPVLRADGTILDVPGYDAGTNLFYEPAPGLVVPPILNQPTESDVKVAVELILEVVADFPFDCDASKANALAAMFTPILSPMISSPVPLVLIDKPQPGTGASLLAEVFSTIATGRPAAMMTAPEDDEAWRKSITSILLRGQLVVTIDNLDFDLVSSSLAAVLTAATYQDRILGKSEMVTLPNRATWVATGNNIALRGDLPRRCLWVRLDAQTARPWQRDSSQFKHPHLIEWVSTNRGAILRAMLTAVRAWVSAGQPVALGLPNLGGFESYCHVVGGVLAYMGVKGFLGNLSTMYDEMDTETPMWESFLQSWHDAIGDKPVTATELITYINTNAELRAALPDVISDTSEKNFPRRLGNTFAKKKGVRYPNGLYLTNTDKGKLGVRWQVTLKTQSHQANLAMGGDSAHKPGAFTG